MEYLPIPSYDDFRVPPIYQSYTSSFPEDERRSETQFRELFHHPIVKVYSVQDQANNIGYLIIWELSGFVFVEHFEVFQPFRSKKYGSVIIGHLFKNHPKIVLEAEPEQHDELAKRRIGFYQRNGFGVIDTQYIQPPYGAGKNPLNLWLLATWNPENITKIKEEIYDVVYP